MLVPPVLMPATGSDQADEWVRLGVEAQMAGKLPEAQRQYQHALRLDPRHAAAMQNLAAVFAQSPGFLNEALLTIERAAMVDGKYYLIEMNWALYCAEAERIDDAVFHAEKAVALAPKGIEGNMPRLVLAMLMATAGTPEKALPIYNKILEVEPKHAVATVNSCFVQTLINATPKDLLAQRQKWCFAHRFEGKILPYRNELSTDRPLRIGYVGGDFKQHSASFIFSHVLLHHTPAVEMYLYSTLPVDPAGDIRTKKFQEACGKSGVATMTVMGQDGKMRPSDATGQAVQEGRWRDITTMNDEDVDNLIRKDRIDILVDLAAHTNGGRLTLFTRKPAPIQVTAWGFAHGTGLPEIDFFFADPIAVPPEEREFFSEKIIDLPCIVTMEPPEEYQLKDTSAPPVRKNGYITFGSYARYEKMSEECLRTFAEIMRQVPDSKMEFKDHAFRRPYSIKRVMGVMADIAPERLLFSLATSHMDHLLAHQQCDLALDPFYHGGGIVSLEQLYQGVPLLTLYGTQPSGRSAASVLTQMGRTDWIARTKEEYVEKAVAMAENPKMLAAARKTLRQELLDSPVVKGYAEVVEQKYKEIWAAYCAR